MTSLTTLAKHTIPGLGFARFFLKKEGVEGIKEKAIALQKTVLNQSTTGQLQNCRTFISQYHNLKSEEKYRLVRVEEEGGRKLHAQLFDKYGGAGHQLTYFIGNDNLPKFVNDLLIPRILTIPRVAELGNPLVWNFTLNTYGAADNNQMAGFEYHKDIPSNGDISLIYSLGATSVFHIRHPEQKEQVAKISLVSNSLVVLSNEARWDFEHSVVPVRMQKGMASITPEIRRISLVLGVRNQSPN